MDIYLLIGILHVAIIVPFLLWIGFNRAAWVYHILFGAGILILVYHGYKAIGRYIANSPVLWVNVIHTVLVAPLLLWIGYHEKKTERAAYDMLLLAAFGALGYHLYKLIVVSQTFVKSPEI